MFKMLSRPAVRLVERYLPDPYIFVVILTLIAALAAVGLEGQSPVQVVQWWGDGFWGLLVFTMQMLLVLVTGYILASTPPIKRLLSGLAATARTPPRAIVIVTLVALAASWINWGFGLVVGALFAKHVARHVRVDYRLLVASAFSGFLVWHGGLSGSVPLTIATEGHFAEAAMGVIPTSQTMFSFYNIAIVLALFVVVPLVNRLMIPDDKDSVYVDPARLADLDAPDVADPQDDRPAARLENSPVLGWVVGGLGLLYLLHYYIVQGRSLDLNATNFTMLFLAILLHGSPRSLLNAFDEAIRGGAGIVLQFPFYAGIMGIMTESGLVTSVTQVFTSIASAETLPFWTFISAGILNMFVPSGGGQWAVQSPIVIASSEALNADLPRVAMAVAWGDAWTNMLQPFWALPVLAIAGLKAKDIMGFCVVHLLVSGVIISIGLTFL